MVAGAKAVVIGLVVVLLVAALSSLAVSLYVFTLLGRQPFPSSEPDTTTWFALNPRRRLIPCLRAG
jgi:hypothetical protein